MTDPELQVVKMVTEVLEQFQELNNPNAPLFIGFIGDEREVTFAYLRATYGDLRRIADAVNDEATLRMIAENQDRIEKFKNELDCDSDD